MGSVRDVLARVQRDGTAVARSDGSLHRLFPVAVSAAEGEALAALVLREHARHTIEVGLGYGISALHICAALVENGAGAASHLVVDPHQATRFANVGLQLLEDAGLRDMVELHAEESQVALPRFVAEGRRFDLAFVDGNHRFDGVFLDLVYVGRLVRPGGIVFVDDHQLAAVERAAAFCVTNLGWRVEKASAADDLHGWAALRTAEGPDTRPYDHFVEF